MSKLTREERFYRTWFKPNNGTLIIVGDTGRMEEIKPAIEKLLWPVGARPGPGKEH
ncbi:MAG: hypothetical protein U1G07_01820 [Verrucomicrobiota bacterium]